MRKLSFSDRVFFDTEPNSLSRFLERLRRENREVLDLTESNPAKAGFRFSLDTLREGMLQDPVTDYAPHPRGLPEAREAITAYYRDRGVRVDPDAVYCTSGTSEAYAMLFKLLGDPGDEILVPVPSYPLIEYLVSFESLHCGQFYLRYQRGSGWRVDRDFLDTTCFERAKALVVVHPNNPTGSYLSADDRRYLIDFCAQRGMALIVDEVFHDYCFLETRPSSFLAEEPGCLTFVLNGFSKTLCLPQVKLSWYVIAGPSDLKREAQSRLDILHDYYLSVNTLIQVAAPILVGKRK